MPSIGGRCSWLWKLTAVAMVAMNRKMVTKPPFFTRTASASGAGLPFSTAKPMMKAGTSQFTSAGMNRLKNSAKGRMPRCQTIRVVMSPKGLKAPPALAPTTMLMQARATNFGLSPPTAMTTAPITSAVVRLSATGEMAKARSPVIQNRESREKPRETSQARRASNTPRSSRVLMKVIAASRNSSSSTYSSRL